MKEYPPLSRDIKAGLYWLEIFLQANQAPEFTEGYFDNVLKQVKYIQKKSNDSPLIKRLAAEAVCYIEDLAKEAPK